MGFLQQGKWKVAQFLEALWWSRYLKGRDRGEYLDWKKNYWLRFLDQAGIQLREGDAVLDAGCGPSGIFLVLDRQKVTALDPLLETYERKFPEQFRRDRYPAVRFRTESLEHADQLDCAFDQVFCLNAINHVQDLEKSLRNLRALTRSGGQCIISTDTHRFSRLAQCFRLLPGDLLHPQQFTEQEYLHSIRQAGFQVKRSTTLLDGWIFRYQVFCCE